MPLLNRTFIDVDPKRVALKRIVVSSSVDRIVFLKTNGNINVMNPVLISPEHEVTHKE